MTSELEAQSMSNWNMPVPCGACGIACTCEMSGSIVPAYVSCTVSVIISEGVAYPGGWTRE